MATSSRQQNTNASNKAESTQSKVQGAGDIGSNAGALVNITETPNSNSSSQTQTKESSAEAVSIDNSSAIRQAKDAKIRSDELEKQAKRKAAAQPKKPLPQRRNKEQRAKNAKVTELIDNDSIDTEQAPAIPKSVITEDANGNRSSVEYDENGEVLSESPITPAPARPNRPAEIARQLAEEQESKPQERKPVLRKGQPTPGVTQQQEAAVSPNQNNQQQSQQEIPRRVIPNEEAQKIARETQYRQSRKQKTDRQRIDEQWTRPLKSRTSVEQEFPDMSEPRNRRYRTVKEYEGKVASNGGLRTSPDESLDSAAVTEKDTVKQDRLIDRVTNEMLVGFFHVKGEKISEKNKITWSRRTEDAMTDLMEYFNISGYNAKRTIFRLARMYSAISTDRNNKMFLEDSDKWSMEEDDFVHTLQLIKRSCVEYGHPLAMVDTEFFIGGSRRYPCGVMPKSIAKVICNQGSNLRCTPAELVQRCQNEWTTKTYPHIKANLTGDKISQRIVIEDMMRGIAALDGMDNARFSERYGVSTTIDFKLSEYEDELLEYASATHDKYDAKAVRAEQRERADRYRNRFEKRRNRVKTTVNGETVRNSKENAFIGGLNFLSSLRKVNGVILNPVLITAALAEHGVGNVTSKLTTAALRNTSKNKKEFMLSDWTLEQFKTNEGIEAVCAAKILFDVGGSGAARLFKETGKPLTQKNATEFCQEYILRESGPKLTAARKTLDKITRKLLVADYAFKKSDAVLWATGFATYNQWNANSQDRLQDRGKSQVGYTAKEIESMIRAEGIAGFIGDALGTDAGINAFIMMRANNIGQVTPISYAVDRFLRDHGVTNFAITEFIDTYPVYGLNYIISFIPFSKTFSYLGVKAAQGLGAKDIGDFQLGGNMDFVGGLRMNLFYDFARLGQTGLCALLIYSVIQAFGGLYPPEDPQDIYNISMWRIGEGESAIEIQEAWWLNDLTLFGLPAAFAFAAKERTKDGWLSTQLFIDGCADMLNGNALLDIVDTVNNCRDDLFEFEKMISDPAYEGPRDRWSFALMQMNLMGARVVGGLIPNLANTFHRDTFFVGNDARARDFGKVYDKSSEWAIENGVTKSVDTYEEYLDRKYSYSNLLYAAFNNIFKNHGDETKTGYFWWEMPVATMDDQQALQWASKYQMDYSNTPEDMTYESYRDEMGAQVLADIDSFENIEDAKDQGYIITHDAREAALDYCNSNLNALDNEWAARLKSGELSKYTVRQPAYNEYQNQREKWNTYIYDWLKNDDIPEWSEGYEKLLTDTEVSYVWKDTDPPQPAPITEMFNPAVEKVYKPKGNHPTSFAPFTIVDTRDRGFNAETIPYWFDSGETGTDLEKLRQVNETINNGIISMGRDQGLNLNNRLFGSEDGEYIHPDQPTIHYRSYVPRDNKLSDDIVNYKQEDATGGTLGESGKYSQNAQDTISGKTSSGNSPTYWPKSTYGYSSSAGGGNYNPKIYNNPRSVSGDRASAMYAKQPYGATASYLRPGFSTKGSREAYKRSDI